MTSTIHPDVTCPDRFQKPGYDRRFDVTIHALDEATGHTDEQTVRGVPARDARQAQTVAMFPQTINLQGQFVTYTVTEV